jgi:hypothetical protein
MGLSSKISLIALFVGLNASAAYAQNNTGEADNVAKQVAGAWKNPAGGACETAFFKAGERTKTVRGEQAMAGTVSDAGMVVPGQLILQGAREGQFVNTMNDKVIFIFEPKGQQATLTPMGPLCALEGSHAGAMSGSRPRRRRNTGYVLSSPES